MEPHSGNASDTTVLPDAIARMNDLCEQLKMSESFLYVADAAAYANLIQYSEKVNWLSRVPATLTEAKELLHTEASNLAWLDKENGYKKLFMIYKFKDGKAFFVRKMCSCIGKF